MVEQFGDMPIHATDWAAEHMEVSSAHTFEQYGQDTDHPRRDEILATTLRLPTRTFSSAVQLDLGDRAVELIHPGRGHTAGDLVVRVPDADVLLGGDLVEESDPPFIGDDSWPLEWPLTLDLVLGLMTDATVVVPGHGKVGRQGVRAGAAHRARRHRRDHPRPRLARGAAVRGPRRRRVAVGARAARERRPAGLRAPAPQPEAAPPRSESPDRPTPSGGWSRGGRPSRTGA